MLNCKLWFEPTRIWQIHNQYTTYDRQGSNTLVLSDLLLFLFVKGPLSPGPCASVSCNLLRNHLWLQYKAAGLLGPDVAASSRYQDANNANKQGTNTTAACAYFGSDEKLLSAVGPKMKQLTSRSELTAAGKRHYATAAALNGELSDDATIRVWWR